MLRFAFRDRQNYKCGIFCTGALARVKVDTKTPCNFNMHNYVPIMYIQERLNGTVIAIKAFRFGASMKQNGSVAKLLLVSKSQAASAFSLQYVKHRDHMYLTNIL